MTTALSLLWLVWNSLLRTNWPWIYDSPASASECWVLSGLGLLLPTLLGLHPGKPRKWMTGISCYPPGLMCRFFSGACHLTVEGDLSHPDFKLWYLPQFCMQLDYENNPEEPQGVYRQGSPDRTLRSSTLVTCFKDPWNQTSGVLNKEFFYGHKFGFLVFVVLFCFSIQALEPVLD